ncbi:hypothetical protein D3C84_1234960 [compost metagenome]
MRRGQRAGVVAFAAGGAFAGVALAIVGGLAGFVVMAFADLTGTTGEQQGAGHEKRYGAET